MKNKYTKIWTQHKGKPVEKKVLNIKDGKFKIDQQYAFQIAPMGDTEESMTIIRMTIPAGTPVEQGYKEIRDSLTKLGYDPEVICKAMGFDEVISGRS